MEDRGESCLEGSSGIQEGGGSLALPSLLQPGPATPFSFLHLFLIRLFLLSLLVPISPSFVLFPPLVPFPDRVTHWPKTYQACPHLSFLGNDIFDLGYLVVLKSEPRTTPSKDSIAKQHPNLVGPCILNSHPPTHLLVSFLTLCFW